MFHLHRSPSHRRRRSNQRIALFVFMRKPAFQFGFIIIAVVLIVILALSGQKSEVEITAAIQATLTQRSHPTGTVIPAVINASSAYALYLSDSAYFLDVRERSEWDVTHIPSTTLLPLGQVASLVDKLPKDKPIIVVSATDDRSDQARDIIKQAGLLNVTSMAGGIGAWRLQGYPLEP
jgi:phage shock protein E